MLAEHRIINKDESLIYQYGILVRKLWGVNTELRRQKFCPFFQITFWLTVLTLLAWPVALLGWVAVYAARKIYVWSERLNLQWIVNVYGKTPLGGALDKVPDDIQKSPLQATVGAGIAAICMTVVACAALGAILGLGYGLVQGIIFLINHLSDFPWLVQTVAVAVWHGIEWAGWAIFMGCAWIGFVLTAIYEGFITFGPDLWNSICSAVVTVGHWIAAAAHAIASAVVYVFTNATILKWAAYIALGGLALFTVYLVVIFTIASAKKSPRAQRIWAWVIYKLNGFHEAREAARKRREEAYEAQRKAEYEEMKKRRAAEEAGEKVVLPPRKLSASEKVFVVIGKFFSAIGSGIGWLFSWVGPTFRYLFTRAEKKEKPYKAPKEFFTGKSTVKVLGSLSITWTFIKAMYGKACPTIDFLGNEDISVAHQAIQAWLSNPKDDLDNRYDYRSVANGCFDPGNASVSRLGASERIGAFKSQYEYKPFVAYVLGRYIIGELTDKMAHKELMARFEALSALYHNTPPAPSSQA